MEDESLSEGCLKTYNQIKDYIEKNQFPKTSFSTQFKNTSFSRKQFYNHLKILCQKKLIFDLKEGKDHYLYIKQPFIKKRRKLKKLEKLNLSESCLKLLSFIKNYIRLNRLKNRMTINHLFDFYSEKISPKQMIRNLRILESKNLLFLDKNESSKKIIILNKKRATHRLHVTHKNVRIFSHHGKSQVIDLNQNTSAEMILYTSINKTKDNKIINKELVSNGINKRILNDKDNKELVSNGINKELVSNRTITNNSNSFSSSKLLSSSSSFKWPDFSWS